jgi:hypothetical protein
MAGGTSLMSANSLPLFYRNPRPLRSSSDAELSLSRAAGYAFARGATSVPLVAADFKQACKHYPIVFTQDDTAWPLALIGLRPDRNLFVDGRGDWEHGAYIPAYVRRYPFIFLELESAAPPSGPEERAAEPGARELTLGIDAAAESIVPGRDNPFFEDGQPTQITKNGLAFCAEYKAQYDATAAFSKAVDEADLLIDNRAGRRPDAGDQVAVTGFRTIDETRFSLLPNAEFLHWRERGWLQLAYCHFVSIRNIERLFAKLRARESLPAFG